MATPNVGILTNAGKKLIDRVNAGQTKIAFSKIVFSSMNNNQLTDDQIKALTTVAPQEIVVNNPKVTLDNNTGETRIRATGNNKALNDGVYVKTYAVYAKDDSSNEILYGITVSPNPNYLPEYDGVTPQAVTYSYKVNISNTTKITFTNSNDVYVSDTDLAEALQPYAKTVDVNQQLDKKVNVADMRKPASDVAGLDDIRSILLSKGTDLYTLYNTTGIPQQYYCGYNPDAATMVNIPTKQAFTLSSIPISTSYPNWNYTILVFRSVASQKVFYASIGTDGSGKNVVNYGWTTSATDNSNGTISVNGNTFTPADDSKVIHNSGDETIGGTKTFTNPIKGTIEGTNYRYSAEGDDLNTSYMNDSVIFVGGNKVANAPAGTSGQMAVVRNHNADVNNGAQSYYDTNLGVLYFRMRNYVSKYTPWIRVADDSKVAHLSGANNFDTVPTVNNNPLLLASSLPSDLARTGSDQEFTGKNKFDTAPIDKTTGNPYITKDGVPSDVARTGQDTNFTGKLQKGGIDVATAADLKSVENSAWHIMSGSSDKLKTYNCWYKINKDKKRLEIIVLGVTNETPYTNSYTVLDLSSIITSISSFSGQFNIFEKSGVITNNSIHIEGAKLASSTPIDVTGLAAQIIYDGVRDSEYGQSGDGDGTGNPAYVYYNDLQDAYK